MPNQARVLQFPASRPPRQTAESALATARAYMALDVQARGGINIDDVFADLDVLLALCGLLRDQCNLRPAETLSEAKRIHGWLTNQTRGLGFFDERDFFLGEIALLAASSSRHVGVPADTELWLDRADSSYRHTINPAASLARVAYVRLGLRYDSGRYSDVLELLPSAALTFANLGMRPELAKCCLLEAAVLKELGRYDESASKLEALLANHLFTSETAIRGLAMVNLGNIRSLEGDLKEALAAYKAARPLLEAERNGATLANLKGMVAETLGAMGQMSASVDAYRETVSDHLELGMQSRAAYFRVALSEVLLLAGRPREAEWELLAALPTINEQQMVPEGFAAVALLQESIRQRKTDPKALSELRQYLQAN
jgi:tetratricopeptide (TPR) repeat protein